MVESISSQQFQELVLQGSGRILVDFSATWCGPCRMLAPVVDQLAEEKAGQLAVYSVDVDQCPDIASAYRVSAVPTLMVFENGNVLRTSTGAQPIERLRELVEA